MSTKELKNKSEIAEEQERQDLETATNLNVEFENKKIISKKNEIIENKDTFEKKESTIDKSIIALIPNGNNNDIIKELNNPNKSEHKITEKKQSFMQKTKSWLGKAWTNFKNSRFNIFKGEEMEECLDAHGFPIKIPKRKHNQQPDKKEENKKEATSINVSNNNN